jgi:hypothetical protein
VIDRISRLYRDALRNVVRIDCCDRHFHCAIVSAPFKMFTKARVAAALLCLCASLGAQASQIRRDEVPANPYDPSTTTYCSWWFDNDGSIPCTKLMTLWSITLADFRRWVSILCFLMLPVLIHDRILRSMLNAAILRRANPIAWRRSTSHHHPHKSQHLPLLFQHPRPQRLGLLAQLSRVRSRLAIVGTLSMRTTTAQRSYKSIPD